MRCVTSTVDLTGLSLGAAAGAVHDRVSRLIAEVGAGERVLAVVQAHGPFVYSEPVEGSYRDVHHSERGVIVCLIIE